MVAGASANGEKTKTNFQKYSPAKNSLSVENSNISKKISARSAHFVVLPQNVLIGNSKQPGKMKILRKAKQINKTKHIRFANKP